MEDLQIIERNGQFVVDSRGVAKMTGKEHKNLLADVRTYIEYMANSGVLKVQPSDFFIESTYINDQNKKQPCYLLTKKGCDMVANKMTGEKGVLFTASYVTKFEEMESQLQDSYAIENPIQRAKAWIREEEERQSLKIAVLQKDQIIGELNPKADFVDTILKNKGLITITQIAKDYGMSAKQINKRLYNLKIQYKQSGQWLLYQKYHDKGYVHSETIDIVRRDGSHYVKMHTKWTQKGRLFIYNTLKKNGILPVIEKEENNV